MSLAIGKLVLSMMHTIMLFITQVNQACISTPGIRMNNAIRFYSAADNGLQGLSGAVRNDLCVDLAASLKDTEDGCFPISAPATFSFNASGSEVRFINFYFSNEGR